MFQDIRRPKKSLREILPGRASVAEVEPSYEEAAPTVDQYVSRPVRQPRSRGWGLVVVALLIVGLGYWVSRQVATATVTITPKQTIINLADASLSLPYEVATLDPISAARPVTATEARPVERKATGKIVIYNAFSSAPERLVANTRFMAASGKIYRISGAVTVPGLKGDVPGSIEATVTADAPGESYNAPLTDFTIPGFKGTPREKKLYARSQTPITGGFAGTERVVPEAEKTALVTELKSEIIARAKQQAEFQIPKDYVLLPDGLEMTWTERVEGASTVASSSLVVEGTPQVLLAKRSVLDEKIVAAGNLDPSDHLSISNLENLELNFTNVAALAAATTPGSRVANVSARGQLKAQMPLDPEELANKLAGQSKAEANVVFQQFPGIASAVPSFHPPWIRSFPNDPSRIKINLVSETN